MQNGPSPKFESKLIAFVDLLGFKELVATAEGGEGVDLQHVLALLDEFRASRDQEELATHGPDVCPGSARVAADVGFRATQISDSLLLSTEVSPAGVATLLARAWRVTVRFLLKGILCRGYITRGLIFHDGQRFVGSGYQRAYSQEREVVFRRGPAEKAGTPFVEIDPVVVEYVKTSGGQCVEGLFNHCVATDGQYFALFPFRALEQSFVIGGPYAKYVNYERIREGNVGLRDDIAAIKDRIRAAVDPKNANAVRKVEHYVAALEQQLRGCDSVDDVLDSLGVPPSHDK
jgi:hypothetical protein